MLGLSAQMAVNTGSSGSPTWAPQLWVKDLKSPPLKFDKAESSTRGTGGVKTNEVAMWDPTVSGSGLYQPGDTQCLNFFTQVAARVGKEFAFGSGPISTTGTTWIRAYCSATIDGTQNLAENQVFDFEVFPSNVTLAGVTFANASWNQT